ETSRRYSLATAPACGKTSGWISEAYRLHPFCASQGLLTAEIVLLKDSEGHSWAQAIQLLNTSVVRLTRAKPRHRIGIIAGRVFSLRSTCSCCATTGAAQYLDPPAP